MSSLENPEQEKTSDKIDPVPDNKPVPQKKPVPDEPFPDTKGKKNAIVEYTHKNIKRKRRGDGFAVTELKEAGVYNAGKSEQYNVHKARKELHLYVDRRRTTRYEQNVTILVEHNNNYPTINPTQW